MADWLERNRGHILTFLCSTLLSGALLLWQRFPNAEPLRIEMPTPAPTATAAPIQVYVSGAVAHPDVYRLESGAIVRDAIWAAGGATGAADLSLVNLAQPIHNGAQVYVPARNEMQAVAAPGASNQPAKICINRASAHELEQLPGIGETYAARIVAYRQANGPFISIEALTEVKGIGPAVLEQIRDLITLY